MINLFQEINLKICGDMECFKFSKYGKNLGTRQLGAIVRGDLLRFINNNTRIALDFEGVDVVSNSFADECLAKLLLEMSLEDLKSKTTFMGLNEFAKKNIAVAFQRRYSSLQVCENV